MGNIEGKYATLKTPFKGYRRIHIIRRCGNQWTVVICGCGLELEMYEDEFVIDD